MQKFRLFRKTHETPIVLENTYQSNEVSINVTNDYEMIISTSNFSYTLQVEENEAKELEIVSDNGNITVTEKINTINDFGFSAR